MGIFIDSITFANEFRAETTTWLLGNIGDKITATIDFTVKTYAIASNDVPFILNNTDGYVGVGWITCDSPVFADFRTGDTIRFYDYINNLNHGDFTIEQKLSDYEIKLTTVLSTQPGAIAVPDNTSDNKTLFAVKTAITGLRFKNNFKENSAQPDFFSLVDGSLQELIMEEVDAADLVAYSLQFQGQKSYQIGGATIQGLGITSTTPNYEQKFRIVHSFYITPFFLAEQWDSLQLLISPDYYNNGNALKYLYEITALYEFTDPNRLQQVSQNEVLGNTGWFNENFNNRPTNYYIDSVVYKRPDTTVIPAIELTTAETTVEITVKNTVDTPFSTNNTKFTLNFIKAPEVADEYQLNGKTLDENFLFDRKLQTVGSAAANGDQFGTDRQVLKDVAATFISSSEIKITAKIAMASAIVSALSALDTARFILFVAVQKHSLTTPNADKVALYVDSNDFYTDASDPGMIVFDNKFLRHPENDPLTEGLTTVTTFMEDEVTGYSLFYIDKTTRLTDEIILRSITAKIKAKNTVTDEEFSLDTFSFDATNLPVISGLQYVDFEQDRVFKIPSTEVRKKIKIKRRTDLDGSDLYYYEIYFPFLVRWEYWKILAGVNSDFFDIAEPNNGFNNEWLRYANLSDWDIFFETIIKATKNGDLLTYADEKQIEINDYDTSADWEPDTILSYKNSDNTALYDGVNMINFLLGFDDVRIEAKFNKVGTPPANLDNISVVFGIEVFEEGGVDGRRRASSLYDIESDSWFKSIDTSNKVKLTLTGAEVKAEVLINQAKIPLDKNKFKITARLYELNPVPADAKMLESGDFKLIEAGDFKILD